MSKAIPGQQYYGLSVNGIRPPT